MSDFDFTRFREGEGADCPSDLVMDRLAAREPMADGERIREHLARCARCAKRLARREAGWDAVSDVDPRSLLSRLRTRADEIPAATGLWARLRRGWATLVPLALAGSAAAAIALVMFRPTVPPSLPHGNDDGVRWKGALSLQVHRMVGSGSQEVQSGASLHPGDRLRFAVDLPAEGYIGIVGIESTGRLYVAWPLSDKTDTKRSAGPRQLLPGSVALDENPGTETLWLVHCPLDVGPPRCSSRGAESEPAFQSGCQAVRYLLNKVR